MADIFERISTNLSGLSPTKKVLLSMFLVGGIASAAVLWLWVQKPDFRILYSNLSSEDAGIVISKFKEMNVPYQLSGDGSSLLVPSERVHELRLLLASQGIPQGGGVGFEIFDKSSFGTTEFAQKLNYRRALQGELARTISQLDEVGNARVHLVIPEPTLFTDQQETTRAAVVISLRPGKALSNSQIQGITHLVSGSVEGLKPEAVTIVDSRGKIRSTGSEGSSTAQMSSTQLDFQRNLEQRIQRKIRTMLVQVVGTGKALVRVSSTLDLRQVEMTEERFDPETQVVRSEQRSQGTSNGTSQKSGPSGIPGVASNVPPIAGQGAGSGASNRNASETTSEVINYEISKTISRIVEPFGTIKRLSVAALIDGTYEEVTDENGVTSSKYLARGEEEMRTIESIVKKAMGYSSERNDQVEVVNVPFKTDEALDPAEPFTPSTIDKIMDWLPVVRQLMGPILILLILGAVVRPILKVLMAIPPQPTPLPEAAGQTLLTGELGGTSGGVVAQIDDQKTGLPTQEDIMKIAGENPQAVTQVVKKWIKEA